VGYTPKLVNPGWRCCLYKRWQS